MDVVGYPGHGHEVWPSDVEAMLPSSVQEPVQIEDLVHIQPGWGGRKEMHYKGWWDQIQDAAFTTCKKEMLH